MRSNIVIWIISAFFTSMGIVVALFAMSGLMRDNRGDFLRLFPSHPILEQGTFDLRNNSYYIAGGTSKSVYLGNYTHPLHVVRIDRNLTDTTHIRLNVEGIMDQKFWSLRVHIDSPNFYLYDGAVPRIYKGSTADWQAKRVGYDTEFFLDIMPINSGSFFIKSLSRSNESILGKISLDSPHYIFRSDLLVRQVDGVFCTDGTMSYARDLSKLVYVYRYRNKFLVMDTSLNILSEGTTIDTITHAKVKIATVQSTGARTFAAPPLEVNKGSMIYKTYLLVSSRLLARNEHPQALDKASVIDVYDLRNTDYLFSFYVLNHSVEGALMDIRIASDRLIVLFNTSVRSFELNQEYFHNMEISNQ